MDKAFTLIELLVVVLIIGILAAVAVPQYQTAVDKSRYTAMMNAVRELKEAEELHYMANGEYSSDIMDFEGSLPAGCTASGGWAECQDFNLSVTGLVTGYVFGALRSGSANSYVVWLDRSNYPHRIDCYAYSRAGERGRRLCQSLGGVASSSSVDAGCEGDCTIYRLN